MHRSRSIAWLLACALPLVHCSDDGSNSGGSASTGTNSTGPGTTSATMTAAATTGSSGTGGTCTNAGPIFALRNLDFGDGNSGQWKSHGFDIDGKQSTGASNDVCQPNSGASPNVAFPDGDQGIDNSFGKNILPLLLSLYPTLPADTNQQIENGNVTTLAKVVCMPSEGDATGLLTKMFGATPLGMTPVWDGTDAWPVQPELLVNPMDPESASIGFANASVTGAAFDANGGIFVLTIPIQTPTASTSLRLLVTRAHLAMTLSPDRKSATGARLGGVLDTEEFVDEMKKVGSVLGLCGTPLFDSLVTQIRQASDITFDASQSPSTTCSAISVGLAFDMPAAELGAVGPLTPVGQMCP